MLHLWHIFYPPPYNPAVDSSGHWAPDVVFDGTGYRMWYETAAGFCYATAPLSGIAEIEPTYVSNLLKVHPNPTSGTFTLLSPLLTNPGAKLKVYNSFGELIKEVNSERKDEIFIAVKQRGIFFVVLESGNVKINQKVIVTN